MAMEKNFLKLVAKFCIYANTFFLGTCSKFFPDAFLVCHILRRKTWKLPYLNTTILGGCQNIRRH
jgi:hypothetical protein